MLHVELYTRDRRTISGPDWELDIANSKLDVTIVAMKDKRGVEISLPGQKVLFCGLDSIDSNALFKALKKVKVTTVITPEAEKPKREKRLSKKVVEALEEATWEGFVEDVKNDYVDFDTLPARVDFEASFHNMKSLKPKIAELTELLPAFSGKLKKAVKDLIDSLSDTYQTKQMLKTLERELKESDVEHLRELERIYDTGPKIAKVEKPKSGFEQIQGALRGLSQANRDFEDKYL